MTTIEDVAVLAGVSVATVSRALRGLPNVAPSTRERVEQAAGELSYVVHPHASRLATRRSATVGVVVPQLGTWYYARILDAIEATLAVAGYDLLPYPLRDVGALEAFLHGLPFRKRVDALIVVDIPFSGDQLGTLAATPVRVITVGVQGPPCHGMLLIDNQGGARAAVRHLLNHQHRRIGLLGARRADDPFPYTAPLERRAGYLSALEERGVPAESCLEQPASFSFAGGEEAMGRLLALDEPPTAVFAMSDEIAIGALKAIRDHGLRVPADVSVVGFDDEEVSRYLGLTTVAQDVSAQGEQAAWMALEAVRGAVESEHRGLCQPPRLIVRATTGPKAD